MMDRDNLDEAREEMAKERGEMERGVVGGRDRNDIKSEGGGG